ncbi:MAG: DUF1684 domain-containing protein [Solirubrobacterales bacterium]
MKADEALALLDWKRRVFGLYAEIRGSSDPKAGWERWRSTRDVLFASHPSSPLPTNEREGFEGLELYDYDPAARALATVEPAEPKRYEIAGSGEPMAFTRIATASFELGGGPQALELYWLDAYGGGLFVPFADTTSGRQTYGAGRYVLDTVKGADLGSEDERLVLDFNFAYNPSCAYDPSWACPLATPQNRLTVPIEAGEKAPPSTT